MVEITIPIEEKTIDSILTIIGKLWGIFVTTILYSILGFAVGLLFGMVLTISVNGPRDLVNVYMVSSISICMITSIIVFWITNLIEHGKLKIKFKKTSSCKSLIEVR